MLNGKTVIVYKKKGNQQNISENVFVFSKKATKNAAEIQ